MKALAYIVIALFAFAAISHAAEGELWVGVGESGRRVSSPDGETWQNDQRWESASGSLTSVAFGLGKFIAVGGTDKAGKMLATLDGKTWSDVPVKGARIGAIAFGQNRFIAAQGAQLLVSTDGAKFEPGASLDPVLKTAASDRDSKSRITRPLAITCGDTEAGFRFLIIGQRENPGGETVSWRALTSDGTRLDEYTEMPAINAIAYGAGHFVAVGRERIEHSHDGQAWENLPCPGDTLRSVVWTGTRFMATADDAIWISRDSIFWQRQPIPTAPPLLWARDQPTPIFLGPVLEIPAKTPSKTSPPLLRAFAYRPAE